MRLLPPLQTTIAAAAMVCLGVASTPAAAYSKIVAFGDSLTDTGNFLEVSTILSAVGVPGFPEPLPQASAYYNGRFSNGRVAVEVLADGLVGSIGDGKSLFLENYAYGGAKTGLDGQLPKTGILSQLQSFSKSLQPGASADANALYFVWGGANDLRDVAANPGNAGAILGGALGNLSNTVLGLYSLGARNFLLPNLPDLGLTPEARSNGAAAMAGATFISQVFNDSLASVYSVLGKALPDAHLVTFDTMAAQRALTLDPASGGLTDVTTACFTGYVGIDGSVCSTPSTFLYFDKVHPTSTVHAILGAQMAAAVPEPSAMLLMAAGVLTLLGKSARRRRQG